MIDDRTLQLRLTGFRKAEASLRLDGMDPSGTQLYESVKVRILSGEITYDEGRAEILAHYQKRANSN
ncbi:antitoxin VbhA family protein [Kosakonia sp. SMBL-WEM22]|uniref:antitoxin VbhA family protein n=1 Tax=Kosakonia sp. SMBL-WEM22 TaxID=2725560 RepID=UPI001659D034|nr:antitoxin VbhA family protein [Kosakonia sp. SMBL-WEM22]QNQ20885.1 antitoxin VbhA family protein [Kosakonia sp. SMBL-WEM22]